MPKSPLLQVSFRDSEAILGPSENLQPGQGCLVGGHEVAGGGPLTPPHSAPQLMQLSQAEAL